MTTTNPGEDLAWTKPDYTGAESWTQASGGFGTRGTPGSDGGLRTEWNTPDIWLRRTFTMPTGTYHDLQLDCIHDEDVEIYLNGVLAVRVSGFTGEYEALPIAPAARATLKVGGTNTLAVHCHQTGGGQYIDVGLADVSEGKAK